MKMVTTVKITEFKERNLSTDLICLAQLVQGGGCSHHSPLSRYIRLYQRYKIEGLHPNRGSNWLWIQISEQRKKSRLILQSGMYTFCVTSHCFESRARPFFFRVCIYRRLGQAKMLQNSVNKYKWKEGMGGGVQFLFYKLSEFKLRYLRSCMRHCKIFFSFKLPVIGSLRKKQKIWEIQKFKSNVRMTSANMTS